MKGGVLWSAVQKEGCCTNGIKETLLQSARVPPPPSFPRRRESRFFNGSWAPAFAGVTRGVGGRDRI